MNILAIDPGTEQSAMVRWDGQKIISCGILPNFNVLSGLRCRAEADEKLFIEMVASYGMPVGREVFETVLWIGRFVEAWGNSTGRDARLIYRRDVKLHHCQSPRANDANIHQALVDKYGEKGTKTNPGVTYGLKKDLWAAFAIATFVSETTTEKQ